MPSFSFKPDFVVAILVGTKRQTIRVTQRCQPGARMHMFTGLRTIHCRKFAVRPCVLVDSVRISPEGLIFGRPDAHPAEEDEFAVLDGFQDYADMCRWFYRHYGTAYFHGFVHRWADVPAHSG